MKIQSILVLLLLVFGIGFWLGTQPQAPSAGLASLSSAGSVQPFFCPADNCDRQLIQKISGAKDSIDVAIYSFTLDSIAEELVAAHTRGVSVRVLFDSSQAASEYSVDEQLSEAGIPVKRMDLPRGILHDKYIIIDRELVGTGSFNYSQNASEYNRENLVFISDPAIARQFGQDFGQLWDAS